MKEDKFKTNPFAKKYKATLEKRRGKDSSEAHEFVEHKRKGMEKALKKMKGEKHNPY